MKFIETRCSHHVRSDFLLHLALFSYPNNMCLKPQKSVCPLCTKTTNATHYIDKGAII